MDWLYNAIGLAGMAIVLAAYFLLQHRNFMSHDRRYLGLNIIGSLAIIVSLLHDWNLPAFLLNISWVGISIYGLLRRPQRTVE